MRCLSEDLCVFEPLDAMFNVMYYLLINSNALSLLVLRTELL
jgi:hypothetical protein